MELDTQTVEKTPTKKQEQDDEDIAIISPICVQQTTEKRERRVPRERY